ncbi:YqhR family membrane protein [Ornithinibacillus halophilus]|uniref:Conserved membrane protein YqhR n=1 Tax=Ornithinibacillus halophilus TaxID=930117 RepID=A0A1M5D020_9BACI|nr:YqhR family membrane protein [Ornithinibacillus halophilus]SHF60132.1 Conserved membrane protein YqhR [Ornithinibacillus halophilus]
MSGKRKELEQNKQEESMTLLGRSLLTGFIGGLFWSSLGVFLHLFNFTEISPSSFVLRSWVRAGWTDGWLGDVVSILIIGGLSVLVALIYYALLKKNRSILVGLLYGLVLWAIVYYVFQPMFPNIPNVTELDRNTIVTTICLFILYGIFIGYSISYDYHDTVIKENKAKQEEEEEAK